MVLSIPNREVIDGVSRPFDPTRSDPRPFGTVDLLRSFSGSIDRRIRPAGSPFDRRV